MIRITFSAEQKVEEYSGRVTGFDMDDFAAIENKMKEIIKNNHKFVR